MPTNNIHLFNTPVHRDAYSTNSLNGSYSRKIQVNHYQVNWRNP